MELPSTEKLLVPFVQMFFWATLAVVFLHGFGFTSASGAVLVMLMGILFYVLCAVLALVDR
jgi:hypothetical protein